MSHCWSSPALIGFVDFGVIDKFQAKSRVFIDQAIPRAGSRFHHVIANTRGKVILKNEYRSRADRITGQKGFHDIDALHCSLAESSPVGVYFLVKGKFRYLNSRFEQSTGYRAEELHERDSLSIVHPEDRERVRKEAIDMLKGKRSAPYAFRTITKDGRIRSILGTVAPMLFHGERAVHGSYMDNTEQIETRRRLVDLETIEASILDALPVAVIVLCERKILFANRAVETVFGWKPEELAGRSTRILYRSDEEYEEIGQHFYPVLESQRTFSEEYPCRYSDGRDILCFVSTSRIGMNLHEKRIAATYEDITDRKNAEAELQKNVVKLRKAMSGIIRAMGTIVEARDPYTAGHQNRVAWLATSIAREMKLSENETEAIHMAAAIHDIGKIYVPAEILSKPGKISEIERSIIRTHPQVGYDILKAIEFPWPIADIVLQHHERMDGSGYPRGLKDGDIRIEARIIALADVVESMSSHRPYRPRLGIHKALEEIRLHNGGLYDSDVVDACLRLFKEKGYRFEEMLEDAMS
jgi:PAS domain S-box-containing protein/putative nucleotidyltransferase with HDIG domain